MSDAAAQVNDLKGLPDQALQHELMSPSGAVPAYLVLAEAQRRQMMRQSAVTQQNQAPVGSVYDDVIRSMMARQPPPGAAPAGATPPASAPPGAPPTPQNFRPPAGMAEGGEVDDEDEDEEDGGDGQASGLGSVPPPAAPAGGATTPLPAASAANDPDYRKRLEGERDAYQDIFYGYEPPLTQKQKDMRAEVDRLLAEAKKREKPTVWDFLTNFGLGMASTPSRNWGQSIAGGAAGMVKGIGSQEEKARKDQLALLGVSSNLDDQMRLEQGKVGDAVLAQERIHQQAIKDANDNQARLEQERIKTQNTAAAAQMKAQSGALTRDIKDGIAYSGTSAQQPPYDGWTFVRDPLANDNTGGWYAPDHMHVTPDVAKFMGTNPLTGQDYAVNDLAPRQRVLGAQRDAEAARLKLAEATTAAKAPTAESQKILYQTALGKIEHERRLAGLPPVNASDLKSVLNAFRTSKTLTSDEAEAAIGFAQANATPASQGTVATLRFEGMGEIRPISIVDTQTGQLTTVNMNDFNRLQASQPGRYVQSNVAMPVMSKEATYGDILYNIGHTRQAVQQLGSMDASQRAELAMALQSTDPKEAVHTFLTGAVGTTMTDQQKEAVIAIRQLMENALMLRQLGAMGQGSDELRRAITDTLPGAKSPDTAYMLRQLDQFYQTVQRLHKGLPALGKPGAGLPGNNTNTPPPPGNTQQPKVFPASHVHAYAAAQHPPVSDDAAKKVLQGMGYVIQ